MRPQAGGGLDANSVSQADLGDAVAEICIVAIACVGQHDVGADPGRMGSTKLVERDLRLGLKGHVVGHTCRGAPVRVVDPFMRQIQPVSDR